MISRFLCWLFRVDLDDEDLLDSDLTKMYYEDQQMKIDDLEATVETLKESAELKEKEYQTLLSKYIDLKVEKDITA